MIKEFEIYHGIAFSKLINLAPRAFLIEPYIGKNNCSYVIDKKVGLYIKYSSKRLSPWRFTFLKEHQDEISEMQKKLGQVFVLLVCWQDGVVTLCFKDVKKILDENYESSEWISAARGKHQMYAVKGKDGSLDFKIAEKDFPKKIFEYLNGRT